MLTLQSMKMRTKYMMEQIRRDAIDALESAISSCEEAEGSLEEAQNQ